MNMKLGFIPRLLIGLVIGVILGWLNIGWIIAITETLRILLGGLVKFFIPLIVIAFIAAGIADSRKDIGRMLGFTVGLAYLDTILAISLAAIAAYFVIPLVASGGITGAEGNPVALPFVNIEIVAVMDVVTALILSIVLGIGATWERTATIRNALFEFRDIILFCIQRLIIPILPIFIACVFAQLTVKGTIQSNIGTFAGMFVLIILMQALWLTIEYSVAGAISGRNPLVTLRLMMPAWLTGFGTMSSAVTMPIALEQCRKVPYLDKDVVDFSIPILNTVHLAGAAMGITIGAMTVSLMTTGEFPSLAFMIQFILLLGIIEVGAVGVPGGSILAALGILETTLGFGESELALMLTLFAMQDGFATATNVTGDGALTMIINRIYGKKDGEAGAIEGLES